MAGPSYERLIGPVSRLVISASDKMSESGSGLHPGDLRIERAKPHGACQVFDRKVRLSQIASYPATCVPTDSQVRIELQSPINQLDAGVELIDRALELNPNLAIGWYASGWIRSYLGEPDLAIEHLARAMRFSPLDPQIAWMQAGTAFAHFIAGRYDEATYWANKTLVGRPSHPTALRLAAASNALADRLEEARRAIERLRQIDPTLRVSSLKDRIPLRRADDLARYEEGLRKAGLPE